MDSSKLKSPLVFEHEKIKLRDQEDDANYEELRLRHNQRIPKPTIILIPVPSSTICVLCNMNYGNNEYLSHMKSSLHRYNMKVDKPSYFEIDDVIE
jgi:hypothetical protein